MSALGNLVVSLALEHASFTKGLDQGSQEALRFAKTTQDAMDRMERSVKSYIGKVSGIGAAYLSVTNIFASINKQVDALAKLDDAAQKTGASVELLSKIQKTATAFGEDFSGKVEPAITKLARGIAGLEDPSNKANAALKALGISSRDSNGQLRDAAQITLDIAKALQGYKDDASKAAVATDLFGKSGAELLPFLNDASANIDKFSGVSAEAASNAAALQDSINTQKQRFDEYVQKITIDVLPALNDIAGAFVDVQTNGKDFANDRTVANWADNLALSLAPVYDTLVNLKNEFKAIIGSIGVIGADIAVTGAYAGRMFGKITDSRDSLDSMIAKREGMIKDANKWWGEAVDRPRDEYEQALKARIANRPNTYGSPIRSNNGNPLSDINFTGASSIGLSFNEQLERAKNGGLDVNAPKGSLNYVSGGDAANASAAKAAASKLQSEALAAKKAYDSLTNSIEKQIEAKRAEYSVNGPLSESEKIMLDVNAKRVDGQIKLTDAQYKHVQILTASLDAETRNAEMSALRLQSEKDYLTIIEQTTAARDQVYTDILDETSALEALAQAKVDEISQLSMTKEQLDALNTARFNEQIGVLETQKAYLLSQPERENEIALIDRQIEALGILRDSVGKVESINKSKADTAEMFGSMEQAARLVWTVFANSGEDAAKAAGRAIKASILDLLYQMTIKKFFVNVVASVNAPAAVSGALIDTSAGGAPGGSIFDRISDTFKNSNIGITSSIEKLGAFLSNGQGGLADKIGGFMGQYSSQIADGIGYLGAAYMATQGNFAGAALTALGTYFGGPIGGAIGGALGSLFGPKVSTKKYSTGVSGVYADGQFSSSNQSGLAGYGRDLGGNDSLASVLKNYSEVISGLLGAYDLDGDVNTSASLFQRSSKKTRAWGYFGASAGGGSVNFSSGDTAFGSAQDAMAALVEKILTQGITGLVATSNLPEGIRALFDGLADKDSIQAMIAASINIGDSQDALMEKYNLTADLTGKVANATGFAGEQLANFANLLVATANASMTTSEQMIKQRDALNERLTDLGANASINGDLKAFDAFLKNLPKSTAEAQKQFADLFMLRDSVGSVQTAWDQVIAGVNTSIYDLLSPAEQAAKDAKAMNDLFAEFGLQVPKTAAELAAIGQAIQQNFNSADEASIDLALAFPTLVAAFTSAKDKIIDSAREMNQFTNLADYRFYKGVANNLGVHKANDYSRVASEFSNNADGKVTVNGNEVDMLTELKELRTLTQQALAAQRDTASALVRISKMGLKTS